MMGYSERGMALIVVLIFLEIFSLLGLYALQSNIWQIRMARNVWEKNNLILAGQQDLRLVADKLLLALPACMIGITTSSELIKQSLKWWQENSCAGSYGNFEYNYVIEFMGNNPCTYIEGSSKNITADYYRITLLVMPMNQSEVKVILQSYVIKANKIISECKSAQYSEREGGQGQRVLV